MRYDDVNVGVEYVYEVIDGISRTVEVLSKAVVAGVAWIWVTDQITTLAVRPELLHPVKISQDQAIQQLMKSLEHIAVQYSWGGETFTTQFTSIIKTFVSDIEENYIEWYN